MEEAEEAEGEVGEVAEVVAEVEVHLTVTKMLTIDYLVRFQK